VRLVAIGLAAGVFSAFFGVGGGIVVVPLLILVAGMDQRRASATSLAAIVRHVRAFGPVVRLELDLVQGGGTIEAHIPRERFDAAALAKGRQVYVSPTNVRVFAEPA